MFPFFRTFFGRTNSSPVTSSLRIRVLVQPSWDTQVLNISSVTTITTSVSVGQFPLYVVMTPFNGDDITRGSKPQTYSYLYHLNLFVIWRNLHLVAGASPEEEKEEVFSDLRFPPYSETACKHRAVHAACKESSRLSPWSRQLTATAPRRTSAHMHTLPLLKGHFCY